MNPEEYDRMYRLEDRYWWFVGRRDLALRLVRKFAPRGRILDLGCGTGVVLSELQQLGEPVGLDFSSRALEYCRQRGLTGLVQARGESLPLASETFDCIVALDILEHIEDDEAAFAEAFRVLRSGGCLVLSVPAFGFLWGPHDVALHHFRRYSRSQLRLRLIKAGFQPERVSYSVFFLFPIVVAIRILEKRRAGAAKASLPGVPEWMNRLLIGLQRLEATLILGMALPWGSSVVAVGRKP